METIQVMQSVLSKVKNVRTGRCALGLAPNSLCWWWWWNHGLGCPMAIGPERRGEDVSVRLAAKKRKAMNGGEDMGSRKMAES